MFTSSTSDTAVLSLGLLIARLVLGLAMAAHGSQKLFGWFGGYGIKGTAGFLESMGFRPGTLFATAAATTEVVSGLLIALGLFGPIGPALMLSVMIVAAVSVHLKGGFFASKNGIEVPFLYAAGATTLALTGPGSYSLDALLGLESFNSPSLAWAALAVGLIAAIGNLMARRPAKAA
jgi:putative oxidoreductase